MEFFEAVDLLKLSLPNIGRYSFRLGSQPDHRLRPQMNRLRDRIEDELRSLLRVRNKILVSPDHEMLSRRIMMALQEIDHERTRTGMEEFVAEAVRNIVPINFSGSVGYIRVKVIRLPDLPMPSHFDDLAARGEGPTVENWVENAMTYPEIIMFERIVLDRTIDAENLRATFQSAWAQAVK